MSEEHNRKLEKIQLIRVKFFQLMQRLGHSLEDSIVGQVLYWSTLLVGRQTGEEFSLDIAKRRAMQLEAGEKRMAFAVVALIGLVVIDINNKQLVQLCFFHVTTLVNRTLENFEICRLFVEKSRIEVLFELLS